MKETMNDQEEQLQMQTCHPPLPKQYSSTISNCDFRKTISVISVSLILFILFITINQPIQWSNYINSQGSEQSKLLLAVDKKQHQNGASSLRNEQINSQKIQQFTKNSNRLIISPIQTNSEGLDSSQQVQQKIAQRESQQLEEHIMQKQGKMKIFDATISLIDTLKTNLNHQKFGQFAYSKEQQRHRSDFLKTRIGMVANPKVNQGLYMSMFNLQIDQSLLAYKFALFPLQYQKIRHQYNLDNVEEELPICVITPSYNNNNNFRIQLNLNSIFTQNYSNYFVVIINDASEDASQHMFSRYIQFYKIPKNRHLFINNAQRKGALSNILKTSRQYCSHDSIVMSIDGDDELIGRNVFKIFNAEYQRLKADVIYSNFYYYDQKEEKIVSGFTEQYTEEQKERNMYRIVPMRFSQLRSFRRILLGSIQQQDLKDKNGQFYEIASDMALYFPLLQLSCGKNYKIEGFHYLYNINTGYNDYLKRDFQLLKDHQIRKKQAYACQKKYNTQKHQTP